MAGSLWIPRLGVTEEEKEEREKTRVGKMNGTREMEGFVAEKMEGVTEG